MNENGTQVPYGTDEAPSYLTDVHTSYAVDFIERAAAREEPFFLYLSPNALHLPIRVAPRHKDFHRELLIPVPGSYGEEDLSDKPRHVVTGATPRTEKRWDKVTEQVLDMTLPIDEMIAQVVAALDEAGVMDETYIFFVSGNGLLRGEHGLGGKGGPYEESILAPMVVRGPGIREGHTMTGFGLNIDIVPTLLHFAGAPEVGGLDGESLFPVLLGNGGNGDRSAVLLELRTSFLGDARFEDAVNNSQYPTYFAVRTPDYLYVEHHTQEAELYDMNTDPFQLDNIPLSRADPDLVDMLQSYLRGLATCAGTDCALAARGADVGAPAFDFVCRNFGCTFTALGSIDEGNHAWDFADGTGAQGYQVEHRYLAAGDFEVTLAIAGQVVEARTVTVPLLAS